MNPNNPDDLYDADMIAARRNAQMLQEKKAQELEARKAAESKKLFPPEKHYTPVRLLNPKKLTGSPRPGFRYCAKYFPNRSMKKEKERISSSGCLKRPMLI